MQGLEHAGRIGLDIGTRGNAPASGQKALAFGTQDEVRAETRRIRMRRQRARAHLHVEHADGIERPEIGRRAGELHVQGQVDVVGQRNRVFAGTDRTRDREMTVDDRGLEGGADAAEKLAAAWLSP